MHIKVRLKTNVISRFLILASKIIILTRRRAFVKITQRLNIFQSTILVDSVFLFNIFVSLQHPNKACVFCIIRFFAFCEVLKKYKPNAGQEKYFPQRWSRRHCVLISVSTVGQTVFTNTEEPHNSK